MLRLYILSWVVLGALAGWVTAWLRRGEKYAPWLGTLVGVAGALAGGFLMHYGGMPGHIEIVSTTLSAIFGAVILAAVVSYVNGRKRYA